MFTWGILRFPCGFPYVSVGNPGFLVVSLWKPGVSKFPPIFHIGKPLVDPSFPAMEAFKPERRVFPLEGNHMEKGSFQDGNPMEICCKLVVSM